MILNLYKEMQDVLQGRGNTARERETVHKMANANRAFAGTGFKTVEIN
jgi:ribosomal protein S7